MGGLLQETTRSYGNEKLVSQREAMRMLPRARALGLAIKELIQAGFSWQVLYCVGVRQGMLTPDAELEVVVGVILDDDHVVLGADGVQLALALDGHRQACAW